MKNNKKIIGAGIFTAIASSLCCIAPLLAIVSGTTGIASTFSWLEAYRIPLLIFTIITLGFAWYQQLKPVKKIDCNCDTKEKPSFFQSKKFLGIITIFALLMTLFPYYSSALYPKNIKSDVVFNAKDLQTINFKIKGMTCAACENHINFKVQELTGIKNIKTSFEKQQTIIEFDTTKTTKEKITLAINTTGYTVIKETKHEN